MLLSAIQRETAVLIHLLTRWATTQLRDLPYRQNGLEREMVQIDSRHQGSYNGPTEDIREGGLAELL